MSAGFTPGPWAIGQRYGRSRTEIINGSGNRAIATVWSHEPTADRNVDEEYAKGTANLRLISAAPDLYEALRKLSFAAQTTGGIARRDDTLVAAIAEAEAALAKAVGQ